jgi:hypothetical protein
MVFLVMPSKRSTEEVNAVCSIWKRQGYSIALQRDPGDTLSREVAEVIHYRPYQGYAEAVNFLAAFVLDKFKECDWIVAAGDDTTPDPNKRADEIAEECFEHFRGLHHADIAFDEPRESRATRDATFGVCQPTGDASFGDAAGPYIERIAGSPFIGREFCLRINQGKGPLNPVYFHMGVDEELMAVATKLGVFWQRPDLLHYHSNWGRPRPGEKYGQRSRMPAFLERANSPAEWAKYKKIFAERKAAGFPGSEPL